ncbi:MAG: DNA recombination protein RmuC, partial [Oceanococcus sp.]
VQLTRYLETAGFEEGTHYKKQVTIVSADNSGQQRPDVVLYLPENRQIIIDSKVSIKAWTGTNQTDDEAERKASLRQHVESLRRHINDLHGKDYSASPDISSLDFVVMFVPIEAAYLAAANEDAHLFQDAFRKGVIVASPTLLLAILKLVSTLWNMHKQEENAAQVLEMAGKIHNKLVSFAGSFEDIGSRLDAAQKAYDLGFKQLAEGRGNAMSQLQKMEKLGIKVKKPLPDSVRKALNNGDTELIDD